MRRLLLLSLLTFGIPIANASLYQPCANDLNPCPLPSMYVDVQVGGYRLDAPGFAFGEVLNASGGGAVNFPEFSIDRDPVTGFYPRLAVGFEFGSGWCPCYIGDNFFIELAVFYTCIEKTQENNVTVAAASTGLGGFAFPRLNGAGDFLASTGDFLASNGETRFSSASLFRKYEYGGFQAQLGSNIFYKDARFALMPYVELDVNSVNQSYLARAAFINISGGINATNYRVREDLTTTYWDFGVGVHFDYRFSPNCRSLFFFGQATGFLSNAETFLDARERITRTPIIAPSSISQKECVFSGKGRGQLGIGYYLGDNFSIAIMGQVDYWGYIPKVQNPHRIENGTAGPLPAPGIYDGLTRIEKTNAKNYAIVLELTAAYF